MPIQERIVSLLNQKFEEEEFSDCFLVEINHNNSKVEVFVDSDSFINFEKCRSISRHLEKEIDENGWLGERYTLEVSSAGTSRGLVFKRQYVKNIGRKLEVRLKDGGKQTGTLVKVTEENIFLEENVRIKEGNKKVDKVLTHEIPF
jgi:ribosome maturation factor RimP